MGTEIEVGKGILSMLAREFDFNRDNGVNIHRASKTIYILSASGMNLSYGFGWYKHGPYSDNVSNDLERVLGFNKSEYEVTKDKSKWGFSKSSLDMIHEIKSKFIDERDLRALEIMASMHFMYVHWKDGRTPYEMKQLFRDKHRAPTYGDNSPITDEQLHKGWVDACNLIAYKNFHDKDKKD